MGAHLRWLLRGPAFAVVLGAALGAVSFVVNLLRLLTYHSPAYDLGFFDQLCWRQTNGYGLTSSFTPYPFLGQHWEPLLGALCQPYHLGASPLWLFGITSVALAVTPISAFVLARAWLGAEGWAPAVAGVATALSPLLAHGSVYDFHPEVLTPALALTALWGAASRRWLVTIACCVLLALVKEDALLVAAGVGWLIWRAERQRRGLAVCAVALGAFAIVVGAVMPAYRGGAPGDLASRYAYLSGSTGTTVGDILGGMLRHPTLWLDHLAGLTTAGSLALALVPLGLLPLLSGWAAAAVVPVLLVGLLSMQPEQAQLHLHYGLQVFPLLFATALLGWRRARRLPHREWLASAAGAGALAFTVALSPLPGGGLWRSRPVSGLERRAQVESVLSRVDPQAPVAATSNLVPELTHRAKVWEFPDRGGAPLVLIDDRGTPTLQSLAAGYQRRRDQLPVDGYRVVASGGGVTLWQRP